MSRAAADRCSRRYRRWVEQAFIGALGPKKWPRLRAHLEQCQRCRETFDRLGLVDRALAPGSPLSSLAVDRMREHIVSAEPPSRPRWVWAGLGAATACAALLLVFLATPQDPGFAPRGMEQRWRGERPPGARIVCVDSAASRVRDEVRAVDDGLPASTLQCTLGDDLQLVYSTPSLEGLTMVALSRDRHGTVHYYAPRHGQSLSLAVRADAVDVALDWSTRLAVHHRPGDYQIEVLFFDRPVSAHHAASGQVAPLERQSARLVIAEKIEDRRP